MKTLLWFAVALAADCWGDAPYIDLGKRVIEYKLRHGIGSMDPGKSFAIDGKGQYYLSGSFQGGARFGTNVLTTVRGSQSDAFVAKYDRQAECLRVRQIHGSQAFGAAAFGTEAVFIAGAFSGDTTIGTIPIRSESGQDILLAKYDGNGNLLWFKQAGGNDKRFASYAASVTVDAAGN